MGLNVLLGYSEQVNVQYRHFAFKAGSSVTEELLASEEEPVQVFGLLGYRHNLRIFIIIYNFFFV